MDNDSKRGRKRTRNEEMWTRNIRKQKRNTGEQYVGRTGKLVAKKKQGPPCKCLNKCFDRISDNDRNGIFERFWSLGD